MPKSEQDRPVARAISATRLPTSERKVADCPCVSQCATWKAGTTGKRSRTRRRDRRRAGIARVPRRTRSRGGLTDGLVSREAVGACERAWGSSVASWVNCLQSSQSIVQSALYDLDRLGRRSSGPSSALSFPFGSRPASDSDFLSSHRASSISAPRRISSRRTIPHVASHTGR